MTNLTRLLPLLALLVPLSIPAFAEADHSYRISKRHHAHFA